MKTIKCRDCNNLLELTNTSKKKICDECREKNFKNHFKTIIKQNILCKKCGSVIKTISKKGSKAKTEIVGNWVCSTCKKEGKFQTVEREVLCKRCNSFIKKEFVKKTHETKNKNLKELCCSCKEEIKRINCINNSNRMKENNPMKQKNVVEKVKTTLKEKINRNELKYKKGEEHYLYKGNRTFGLECRSKLYKTWIFPILERDCFSCVLCKSNAELQVHHIFPLRDIIKTIFEKNKVEFKSAYFTREKDKELFEKLLNEVVLFHTIDMGITVCKTCHSKIDKFYKVRIK